MKHIFLIFGYGVPQSIISDAKYSRYLTAVFNSIYQATYNAPIEPIIITSGGPTDLFTPYKRIESLEMIKFLKHMRKNTGIGANWQFIAETESLSSLENLVFCKKIIQEQYLTQIPITIFCEYTRVNRIQTLDKQIFPEAKITICPVDFDTSKRRYESKQLLEAKETQALQEALWALKSTANLHLHHVIYTQKFALLRKTKVEDREVALKKWWQEKIAENKELYSS